MGKMAFTRVSWAMSRASSGPTPVGGLRSPLEAGLLVGHAGRCFFPHEMFGKEEHSAMKFIYFQRKRRPVMRCFSGAGPVPEAIPSYRSDIAPKTPLPGRHLGSATKWAKMRVCTMCTPWASDRAVLVPDWAGLGMFGGSGGLAEA